jgi:hypothetical protein
MSRGLKLLPLALVLTALPAAAQEQAPSAPCTVNQQFETLGVNGAAESFVPRPVPSFGHDVTQTPYSERSVSRYLYQLDLSGSDEHPFANAAKVEVTLTWNNDSDLDLYVYDGLDRRLAESTNLNPVDGTGERVVVPGVRHCSDLRVDVVNYLGLPTSTALLELNVREPNP